MTLVVKENGIYETRGGIIVGPTAIVGDDRVLVEYGRNRFFTNREGLVAPLCEHPFDLKSEIVVGEGWRPWNGGENPCEPGARVRFRLRYGYERPGPVDAQAVNWYWRLKHPDIDLVAYMVERPHADLDAFLTPPPPPPMRAEWHGKPVSEEALAEIQALEAELISARQETKRLKGNSPSPRRSATRSALSIIACIAMRAGSATCKLSCVRR